MKSLELAPYGHRVALLLRHAHRNPSKPGDYGNEVNLTQDGVHTAEMLGVILRKKQIGKLLSSPLARCVQTAQAISRGLGRRHITVGTDWRLGNPGAFVKNPALAGPLFLQIGSREIVHQQLTQPQQLKGIRSTKEGVHLLLDFMLSGNRDSHGFDIFITHDAILAVMVGYLFETDMTSVNWPDFLEGLFLWESPDGICASWGGTNRKIVGIQI